MHSKVQRPCLTLILGLLVASAYSSVVFGQDQQLSQMVAPPPVKTIPKEERAQLEAANDSKQRLRLTVELAGTHLALAEKYTAQSNYEAASAEVGVYHALIENALTFLSSLKRDSNKTRDLYKRLELSLRDHGPRLTSMRRTTPLEFAVWIKQVEDFARNGRTEALNSFYGHTVVHDLQPDDQKAAEKPKDVPPPKSRTP